MSTRYRVLSQDRSWYPLWFLFQLPEVLRDRDYSFPGRNLHRQERWDGRCCPGYVVLYEPWCTHPCSFALFCVALSGRIHYLIILFQHIFCYEREITGMFLGLLTLLKPIRDSLLTLLKPIQDRLLIVSIFIFSAFCTKTCPRSSSSTSYRSRTRTSWSGPVGSIVTTRPCMFPILVSKFRTLCCLRGLPSSLSVPLNRSPTKWSSSAIQINEADQFVLGIQNGNLVHRDFKWSTITEPYWKKK